MNRYRVKAPYVLARTVTPDGLRMVGLGEGALVPDDVPEEWVERHLRKGMIEKLPGAEPAPTPPAPQQVDTQREEVPPPAPAAPAEPSPPPATGPGSGRQAWIDYAVASGMSRDEASGLSRDDLIAALRKD